MVCQNAEKSFFDLLFGIFCCVAKLTLTTALILRRVTHNTPRSSDATFRGYAVSISMWRPHWQLLEKSGLSIRSSWNVQENGGDSFFCCCRCCLEQKDFLVFDLMTEVGDGEILICSDVDDDDDTLESSSHLIYDFLTFWDQTLAQSCGTHRHQASRGLHLLSRNSVIALSI